MSQTKGNGVKEQGFAAIGQLIEQQKQQNPQQL
jgi:hypothetical protein